MMIDLLAALADRGCLHIIFRILAALDSWDLQVNIIMMKMVMMTIMMMLVTLGTSRSTL